MSGLSYTVHSISSSHLFEFVTIFLMSMAEIRLFGIKKAIPVLDDEPWQKIIFPFHSFCQSVSSCGHEWVSWSIVKPVCVACSQWKMFCLFWFLLKISYT